MLPVMNHFPKSPDPKFSLKKATATSSKMEEILSRLNRIF